MSEKQITILNIGIIQIAGFFAFRGAWAWLQNESAALLYFLPFMLSIAILGGGEL